MYFTNKTLVSVLKTEKQDKDRSTERLIIQVRENSALDQSENSEVTKIGFWQKCADDLDISCKGGAECLQDWDMSSPNDGVTTV